MINKQELAWAIKTQISAYNLVIWLNSALKKGIISPQKAIEYTSSFEFAQLWIIENYDNLPIDGRPENLEPEAVKAFINMFLLQFSSSFEIIAEPGTRYVPHHLRKGDIYADNPYIRTKKLSNKDKISARNFKLQYLKNLARAQEISLENSLFETMVDDANLKDKIAMTTYALQLIERLKGIDNGLAMLALWREFAWDAHGTRKKKFNLDLSLIIENEVFIIKKLKSV